MTLGGTLTAAQLHLAVNWMFFVGDGGEEVNSVTGRRWITES